MYEIVPICGVGEEWRREGFAGNGEDNSAVRSRAGKINWPHTHAGGSHTNRKKKKRITKKFLPFDLDRKEGSELFGPNE